MRANSFCIQCGSSLTGHFRRCHICGTKPLGDQLAVSLQGLAIWHLLLSPIALVALTLLLAGRPKNDPPDDFFYFDYVGAVYLIGWFMAIASLLTGFVMAGVSLARLRKSFFHVDWELVLLSGLAGTLMTILIAGLTVWIMTIFAWPVAEVAGGFVAYYLVGRRVADSRGVLPA